MIVEANPDSRIAVIGTGSMGSMIAARLSSVADVTMIGSWVQQIQSVNTHGMTLLQPNGESTHHAIKATQDWREVGKVKFALVLVKSWQTEQAAKTAKQILEEDGLALTLQNGIGNLERIAAEVGWRRAALGVTSDGATMIEPGVVHHAGHGLTHIASTPETADRVIQISELFKQAGFDTHLVEDADSLVWGKLAVNAGINPLTSLLQVPNGFLVEEQIARRLMKRAALETALVAKAQGISLPYPDAARKTFEVARETAANYSSMAQDVSRGTPTEIETITGAIVELGQKHNVSTPTNEALLFLMRRFLQDGEWRSAVSQLPEATRADFISLIDLKG
jgi:2-dehydropantoate 2-reductase